MSTISTEKPAPFIRLAMRLHHDQRGTISIVAVFAVLLLTMLLGMVINSGRQIDGKIRMQNAADAAAYSGGAVITRGMNDLAFTNNLLCEVFAMVALMREARDRNAESYVPEILAAWDEAGETLERSPFEKFHVLGEAIPGKTLLEQQLVTAFGDWMEVVSLNTLPLMEEILLYELIPQYQRAVVEAFPDIAQTATMEIARRNGATDDDRGEMLGVLWRIDGRPVGFDDEAFDPTLPVLDPMSHPEVVEDAVERRKSMAHQYRRLWINRTMSFIGSYAKMSRFRRLWEEFTCGQLDKLLEEYPSTNLPHVIRFDESDIRRGNNPELMNRHLDDYFTFLAVVYWRELPEMMPGLYENPMENDATAYAQVRVFVPRRRLVWLHRNSSSQEFSIGGAPGDLRSMSFGDSDTDFGGTDSDFVLGADPGVSQAWDLFNQHWTCQLVPATTPYLSEILQGPVPLAFADGRPVVPPNFGGVRSEEIHRVSPH